MQVMITGDRRWTDDEPMEHWLAALKKKYDIELELVVDDTPVGSIAGAWAIQNAVILHRYPGRLVPEQLGTLIHPGALMVFHNFVPDSKATKAVVSKAKDLGIPFMLINRKGEQYQWTEPQPDQ